VSGSQGNVGKVVNSLIMIIVRFEIICLVVGLFLGLISSLSDFSDLCFRRYDSSMNSNTYSVAANVTVRGDGNYTTVSNTVNGRQVLSPDPDKYGQWVRANFIVQPGQTLQIEASGNLSLCRAYVPLYHLQNRTIPAAPPNAATVRILDINGREITVPNIYYVGADRKRVPIPRVGEQATPLTLIFDAQSDGWRNLTEVYRGDLVKVILQDNYSPPSGAPIVSNPTLSAADCNNAPAAIRTRCNNAVNINTQRTLTLAFCNSLTGDRRTACITQVNTALAPPAPSLTMADCNAMNVSLRAACIAAIPAANATPVAAPVAQVPVSLNAQQLAAAASRDNILNVQRPAAELARVNILNDINTQLDIDRQAESDRIHADYNTAHAALVATKDADLATITASAFSDDQKIAQRLVVTTAFTNAEASLQATSTASLSDLVNRIQARRVNLVNQLAAADQNIAMLTQNANQYDVLITDLGTNILRNIVTDSITNSPTVAVCAEGRRVYSPICGRYSLWNGTQTYSAATGCGDWDKCSDSCNCRCPKGNPLCWGVNFCSPCSCLKVTQWDPLPPTYLDNQSRTLTRFTDSTFMLGDYTRDPTINTSTSNCTASITPNPTQYWFTARDAAGLQQRFDTQVFPRNAAALGQNFTWARILPQGTDPYPDSNTSRKIYSGEYGANQVGYLQYRFHGVEASTRLTGGYVLKLYQTKCQRVNGNAITDSFVNRGAVQYLVLPSGTNPNDTRNVALTNNPVTLNFNGTGSTIINTGDDSGYFWFKINNDQNDYTDSFGSYVISISGQQNGGSFTLSVMDPLFRIIRDRVYDVSLGMFTNMTCYQKEITSNCTNFFNYIRALLMLYVMIIGYRFLLGEHIKQADLVKSLAKVAIVAGLINGQTFEYFREHIFPFVTGFSDQMISNMSGFSMISSTNSISNPFMFLDAIMSKMFLNPTFFLQVLTIMGMGLTGILFFLIVCVAVIIFIIAIFRAISIYIMALIATAFLIGMAPLFIVFILFDRTYYLFENWAKFLFKYMMEPVIVMAGIIILTQLFSLYVDEVLSYSLCWKCTIPFRLPFASILPFPGLANIPLFCIYWFGPWGLNPADDLMGMNMAMMVGMAMVAYSAYGYVELAAKMAERLCGAGGGPSSISTGGAISHDLGQVALEPLGLDNKSIKAAKAKLKNGLDDKKLDKAVAARGKAAEKAAEASKSTNPRGSQSESRLNPTMRSNPSSDVGSADSAISGNTGGTGGGASSSSSGQGGSASIPPISSGNAGGSSAASQTRTGTNTASAAGTTSSTSSQASVNNATSQVSPNSSDSVNATDPTSQVTSDSSDSVNATDPHQWYLLL
jgi:type IV secretion system protein VirB6